MDKSQSVGIVVMALFVLGYLYFFAPKTPEEPQGGPTATEQTEQLPNTSNSTQIDTTTIETTIADDSTHNEQLKQQFGNFIAGAEGKEETFTLENENIIVEFSNKGGVVKKVTLKGYEDFQFEKVVLLNEESSNIQLMANTANGPVNLAGLYFQENKNFTPKTDTAGISFTLPLATGGSIVHTYYLPKNSFTVIQKNNYDELKKQVIDGKVSMVWKNDLRKLERDIKYNRTYTGIKYYSDEEGIDDIGLRSNKHVEEDLPYPINWVSFKQRFFVTSLISNSQFTKGRMSTETNENDTAVVKSAKLALELPLEYFDKDETFKYYFGPIKFNILKKVAGGFEENLDLGWPVIKWINRFLIISVFNFLEKFIGSYGLIIILLVFVIRIILSPLTYRSHMQMAKTKVLKPELDEIKEKHEGDMQKIQSEQMKLYKQVGVNPLSGCIPLVLQMPILFAMFQFIPHAIELRHESFLWAKDLSMYDSIINLPFNIPFYGDHVSLFTLLMTASTILITWSQGQMTASTVQGPMKSMQYMMPIIFLFVLNSFPSGLTFYYFVSNIVSFTQISLIKRFVDEDKIRRILDENRLRNSTKKKSKFQARLEEAMKASEDAKKKKKK